MAFLSMLRLCEFCLHSHGWRIVYVDGEIISSAHCLPSSPSILPSLPVYPSLLLFSLPAPPVPPSPSSPYIYSSLHARMESFTHAEWSIHYL